MVSTIEREVGSAGPPAIATSATEIREPSRAGPGNVAVLHLLVIAFYLLLAVALWWHVWLGGHPSTTITSTWGDPSQELWWLRWLPWAILHGHNPLFTHAMNAGHGGVNGLANPSDYLPSLLASPLTLLAGPILSFNVLGTLTPVVSGWCMFMLCRRLTSFVPGQVLAGVLWGFSPFVVTNLPLGHLNLVTGFFPPLVTLAAINLVDPPTDPLRRAEHSSGRPRGRYAPRSLGLALAGLTVAQFFVSTEMLADTAILGCIAVVAAMVLAPRRIWAAHRRILAGLAWAGGASAAVLAYPTWFAMAGPATVRGDIWGDNGLGLDGATVLHPGPYVHSSGMLTALVGYLGPSGPSYLYLGIPLVGFLILSVVVWYRRRIAWTLVITGAAAWACSLGQPLHGSLRPWGFLRRLPMLEAAQPQRMADFVMFAAALLLGLSLDGWNRVLRRIAWPPIRRADRRDDRRREAHWLILAVLGIVGALLLVPIAVTYTPIVVHPESIPSWYSTVAPSLPDETRLLTLPLPDLFPTNAMAWQAEDDIHFDMIGGYAIVPGRNGHDDSIRSPFLGTTTILQHLTYGEVNLPSRPNTQTLGVRRQIQQWGVDVVVVSAPTFQPTVASTYLTAVMGRAPTYDRGAWVWYGLGSAPARPLTSKLLQWCTTLTGRSSDPLTGPHCVLALSSS